MDPGSTFVLVIVLFAALIGCVFLLSLFLGVDLRDGRRRRGPGRRPQHVRLETEAHVRAPPAPRSPPPRRAPVADRRDG